MGEPINRKHHIRKKKASDFCDSHAIVNFHYTQEVLSDASRSLAC